MAEKNTQDNQNSKKKHKWIGIFLIALLILFIGLAGYYLEKDLEPMPDNQIEDSKVLDESADSSKEAAMNNGEESETTETEEITATKETPKIEEEIKEDTASNEGAVSSDMKTESEQPAVEQSTETEQGENEMAAESDMDAAAVEDGEDEITADSETEVTEVEKESEEESDDALVEDKDSSMTADSDVEKDKVEKESDIETESGVSNQQQEEMVEDLDSETEVEKLKTEDSESDIEDSSVEKDGLIVSSDQNQEADSDTEELDKSDIDQESEDFVEDDSSQLDSGVDSEGQAESESQNDFSQELEDPTLLDRILSILGLSDSSFSQDLNILFVGLDDEESVAVGTIEADSIMLVKLRPEIDKLQLEHIDEDTNYKGQLLREYHNGDIQLAVEEITETEIDYYVYVNYQGFEKVIDELGGVKITLDKEVKVPGLGLNLKAGDNLLSGKEALNFVRWKGSDSMARFERQKLLINSVVTKLKSNNILFNVKELYNTIVEGYNSIETDINPVLAAEIFNYLRENDELELEFIE